MSADRRGRLVWVVVAAVLLGAAAWVAPSTPAALRSLDAFRVRHVEVQGIHYLTAHEVLEASGIRQGSSVFDDVDAWRTALLRHPLIEAVQVERDLPGRIVLRIDEAEPIAFARTPVLYPVDAAGWVLPIDPAAVRLDLPIIAAPSGVDPAGRLTDAGARALLAVLGRVRRLAPALARRASEVQPAAGGTVRLLLRDPRGIEVLLPAHTDAAQFERLRRALAHLVERGELGRVRRLDLRFRDQIVVALIPG